MMDHRTTSGRQHVPAWGRVGRMALLLIGLSALVAGGAGGLFRLPVSISIVQANWVHLHGPMMVCGFLGTLIGIERAVGLGAGWTWTAPVFTGIGGIALVAGVQQPWPLWVIIAGSGCFVAVNWKIHRMQRATSNAVMAAGSATWFIGNVRWALGAPISQVVLWWLAFLLLTIAGERIQLARFRKPSKWSKPCLFTALGLLAGGLLWSLGPAALCGGQLVGLLVGSGLAGLAVWLAIHDIARMTIRQGGLPRFMATCLLAGYVWMMVTALLLIWHWPQTGGFLYDATLHAFFMGFAFSMIFGHAPMIFPAVLGLPIRFRTIFYLPVTVLHLSLVLRVAGDLWSWPPGRVWGGIGNATAAALFLALTLASILCDVAAGRRSGNPSQ
ncbi:MAG: hypothetical protein Q8Q59_09890 [Luteolibacter sp.]|nr:hypothetical protein [Luteolibacter sp.]